MTVAVWRIAADTPRYEAHDLAGTGAEMSGGRWNPVGTPAVYAATSIALAVLETLVHFSAGSLPLNRYLVRIDIPDALWTAATLVDPDVMVGWDATPPGAVSIDWGAAWCAGLGSALALVPSVVVPEERNVLINPRHADARDITACKLRKWLYDPRSR